MFDVSKSEFSTGLFEILKMLYPPKGVCESRRVHLTSFHFIVVKEVFDISNSAFASGLFEISKMFYLRMDGSMGHHRVFPPLRDKKITSP